MNKNVVKGSVLLIISGLICKILGALFRLPLTNILGIKGIGVFQMVMALYSFALILCSGGITVTLSRLVAKGGGETSRINSLYRIALITSTILGIIIGGIFFILARQISLLQGQELSSLSYKLMIILLPLGGVIAGLRGVIQGREEMLPTAVSQLIEQSIRFVLGLLFAGLLIKFGIEYGVFGAFLGIVFGEIISVLYLFVRVNKMGIRSKGRDYKGFFFNLIPLFLGTLISPMVGAIDSLIIVNRLSIAGFSQEQALSLFGLQTGLVGAVLNLPLIISSSIAVAILPSISSLQSDNIQIQEGINNAFKLMWLILLPIVLGIMAICQPLYRLLYSGIDEGILQCAVTLTRIGGVATIITALMQFFVAILQARGNLYYLMGLQLLGGIAKVLSVVFLCSRPEINIYGLVLSNIVFASIVCIGCLLRLKKTVTLNYFDLSIPIISSVLMFLLVVKFIQVVKLSSFLSLIFSIFIGGGIYIVLTFPCVLPIIRDFYKTKIKRRI